MRPLRVTSIRERRAHVGDLAGPSGRIARVQEVDAAWQALWRDQYSAHIDAKTRQGFDNAYKGWQRVKETIGAMNRFELMLPATGAIIDRYNRSARDWRKAMLAAGIKLTSPDIRRPDEPTDWRGLVWGVAAIAGAVAIGLVITKLPKLGRVGGVTA